MRHFRMSSRDHRDGAVERIATTVIELADAGPFLLPPCFRVELGVGEGMGILELITDKGQKLLVPIGVDAMAELYDLTGQALVELGKASGVQQ
jgi:hypothetical protein